MNTNLADPDAAFARPTRFWEQIEHGMLSAGLISNVKGMRLPGPDSLYMRRSLRFAAPVRIGQTVTATIEVTALNPEKQRTTVGHEVVIGGEACVQVPSRG
jgi:3-hydroxybutyryl-CoA dehydratase